MYNKIAQIILNSGKALGASGVYVAQPDSLKESLAGKIFILGEVDAKKSEAEKIINFLITDLEDNYYNDEKILLRGKIEGLKIENIFEAALAKTNKNLSDFLLSQKIRLNTSTTSLTIGVIYENKLHFSNFGKNRASLIYRRSDGYEIINVETSAEEIQDKNEENEQTVPKASGLFSSVISGEIPLGSYFVFTSESVPEYLSSREMVEIITKLPPIVAAEQIKNVLSKINIYVPFLGIIIKNTTDSIGQEIKDFSEQQALSVQTSISSLNSTEQRTEQMLAPAGIISLKKITKITKTMFEGLIPQYAPTVKKMTKTEIASSSSIDLSSGSTRFDADKPKNKMLGAGSFLRPQKIKLKQTSYRFFFNVGKLAKASPALVRKSFWSGLFSNFSSWGKSLNKMNRALFIGLVIVAVAIPISLYLTDRSADKKKAAVDLENRITQLKEKDTLIDQLVLYDAEGAAKVLGDARAILAAFPKEDKLQQASYAQAAEILSNSELKVNKIKKISTAEKIKDVSGLNISKLTFADGKLYGAGASSIHTINLDSNETVETKVDEAVVLDGGKFDDNSSIYYRDGDNMIKFDTKTKKITNYDIKNYIESDGYTGFSLFNQKVYMAAKNANQIHLYGSNLSTRSDWIKEAADLSQVTDIFIDGSIYALNSDGSISKFYRNKKADYSKRALDPIASATKILGSASNLYILDSATKRIAVLAKQDGHLMNQFIFENLSDLRDFSIDEEGKTLYLLSGDGIYKFTL